MRVFYNLRYTIDVFATWKNRAVQVNLTDVTGRYVPVILMNEEARALAADLESFVANAYDAQIVDLVGEGVELGVQFTDVHDTNVCVSYERMGYGDSYMAKLDFDGLVAYVGLHTVQAIVDAIRNSIDVEARALAYV